MQDEKLKPVQIIALPEYSHEHDHLHSQVVIGLKGLVSFNIEGTDKIIGPGQGCIIPSSSMHKFLSVNEDSSVLILNKGNEESEQSLTQKKLVEKLANRHFFQLDASIQQLIHMLMNEMQGAEIDSLIARSCGDTILALLDKHSTELSNSQKSVLLDLDAINRIIDANLSSKLTVAQLATAAFLAESQFFNRFRQQMRKTPHQYVMERRIEWVKTLIEEQRYALGQIAEYCGFSSQSAMSNAFVKQVGLTPSAYRQLHAIRK